MITYAPKIKQVKKNKPKITLKKVFQGYKQSSQTGKAVRQRLINIVIRRRLKDLILLKLKKFLLTYNIY